MADVIAALVASLLGGAVWMQYAGRGPGPAYNGEPEHGEEDVKARAVFELRQLQNQPITWGPYRQSGFINNPASYSQQNRLRPGYIGEQIDVETMKQREARSNAVQMYAGARFAFRNTSRRMDQHRQVQGLFHPQTIGRAGLDLPNNDKLMQYPLLSVRQFTGKAGNDWLRPQEDYIGRTNGVADIDDETRIWTRRDSSIIYSRNPFNPAGILNNKLLENQASLRKPRPFTAM